MERIWGALGITPGLPRLLLALLLAGDVACIVLYLWLITTGGEQWYLHLGAERGYGEAFQYLKQLWCVILLATAWRTLRSPVLLAWLAVMAYFLADDAGGIHERVGRWVIDNYLFAPGFGDQRSQLVELLWMAGVGALLALLVVLTHRRSTPAGRAISVRLAVLFALLIFCGIVIDAVHLAFDDHAILDPIFFIAEDGGELVVLSVITAYLLTVVQDQPAGRSGPRLSA